MELPILVLQDTLNQQKEQLSRAEKDLNKDPKFKEFRQKGITNLKGFIAELEEGINILTLANKQKEAFSIQRVSNSFDFAKANLAIIAIKNAECESDVLNAVSLKEDLNWFAVSDWIKDLWNEAYGDAKKYLP